MFTMLQKREIIVGITGGIAAYKIAELVRALTKLGANVHVVMTKNAMEFITPLTFQTISGNPVTHDMFELFTGGKIGHIALSDIADQMVIAPATANVIGKVANGIADDFLTTMMMATTVPVLFVPSMNTKMWESSIVQANIEKLKENGYEFMEPASGDLACGWQGKGRLPAIERHRGKDGGHLYGEGLPRSKGPGHRRSHDRVHRPGAVHHEPLLGEDGVRHRQDREEKGGGGGPYDGDYVPAAAEKRYPGHQRGDRRADEGGGDGRAAAGVGGHQGGGRGRLPVQGGKLREDQEERGPGGDDPHPDEEPGHPRRARARHRRPRAGRLCRGDGKRRRECPRRSCSGSISI